MRLVFDLGEIIILWSFFFFFPLSQKTLQSGVKVFSLLQGGRGCGGEAVCIQIAPGYSMTAPSVKSVGVYIYIIFFYFPRRLSPQQNIKLPLSVPKPLLFPSQLPQSTYNTVYIKEFCSYKVYFMHNEK